MSAPGLPPPPAPLPGSSPGQPLVLSDPGSDGGAPAEQQPDADQDGGGGGGGGGGQPPPVAPPVVSTNNPYQDLKLGLVLCSKNDRYRHITTVPNDVSGFQLPTPGAPGNIDSLHSLQADMQAWVTGNALITAMDSLVDQMLPDEVRDHVYVGNWEASDHFRFRNGAADERRHNDLLDRIRLTDDNKLRGNRQLRDLRRRIWSLLTVNVDGNHWVTVLIALNPRVRLGTPPPKKKDKDGSEEPADGDDKNKDGKKPAVESVTYYPEVQRLALIEGLYQDRAGRRTVRRGIFTRLESLLRRAGLRFPSDDPRDWRRNIWAPDQDDTLLGRLARIGDAGETRFRTIAPDDPECRFVFEPLPGWFHYEAERWEIVGRNAGAVVRACDYRARVAVEIVQEEQGKEAKEALNLPKEEPEYILWPTPERDIVRRRMLRKRQGTPSDDGGGGGSDAGSGPELGFRRLNRRRPKYRKTPVVLVMPPPTVRKGGRYLDILPAGDYAGGGSQLGSGGGNNLGGGSNDDNPFTRRQEAPTGIILRSRQPDEQVEEGEEPPRKKVKTTAGKKGIPPLGKTPAVMVGGKGTRKVPPRKPAFMYQV
ncbi:hypothetical protein PG985_010576 [Apiospora marii]|uniref:uncharacterized protein n=1 Tax=Apiospora marii TaxID=335849 RepID=UPI003130AB57